MSMPLASHFTAEQVRALPDDGKRYETVHGELLVTPAPGGLHQPVLTELSWRLGSYLGAPLRPQLLTSPADIIFDDDTLVQPDLLVAETSAFLQSGDWRDVRTLHLVVEIVSPSSTVTDRTVKRRLYQQQRIPHYWIVDTDQKHVEIWTPDAKFHVIENQQLLWRHPALEVDFTLDLPQFFSFGGAAHEP